MQSCHFVVPHLVVSYHTYIQTATFPTSRAVCVVGERRGNGRIIFACLMRICDVWKFCNGLE